MEIRVAIERNPGRTGPVEVFAYVKLAMKRRSFLAITSAYAAAIHAGTLTARFITAKLARGVSIALPNTWEVVRGKEMKSLETSVASSIDLSGYSRVLSGAESLLFAAFPDQELYASATVTAIPIASATPNYASQFSINELPQMERVVRESVDKVVTKLGAKTSDWTPLKVERVGGSAVFHITYQKTSEFGDTRVHLYKFFSPGYVFDVALSTRLSSERINAPVLSRIIQSVVVPR
jgi:hypothetical protein